MTPQYFPQKSLENVGFQGFFVENIILQYQKYRLNLPLNP